MQPLWKTVERFLRKLELPYDPAIQLLGMYPDKTLNSKRYMHSDVYSSTIYNSQDMQTNVKCPLTDVGMKNICCIYTMEYKPAIKKE